MKFNKNSMVGKVFTVIVGGVAAGTSLMSFAETRGQCVARLATGETVVGNYFDCGESDLICDCRAEQVTFQGQQATGLHIFAKCSGGSLQVQPNYITVPGHISLDASQGCTIINSD